MTVFGYKFQIEILKRVLIIATKSKTNKSYSSVLTSNTASNDPNPKNERFASNNNSFKQTRTHEYIFKNVRILIYTNSILNAQIEAITNSLDKSISFNGKIKHHNLSHFLADYFYIKGTGLAGLILKKFGDKIEDKARKKAKSLGIITTCMVRIFYLKKKQLNIFKLKKKSALKSKPKLQSQSHNM